MEIIAVTYAQAKTVKAAMSPIVTILYSVDPSDPTQVVKFIMLDPKLGGLSFAWSAATEIPTETQFLIDFSGAIKVADLI